MHKAQALAPVIYQDGTEEARDVGIQEGGVISPL